MTFDTTNDIDRLLAGARLVPMAPYSHADIEAAEARVAARVAARGGDEPTASACPRHALAARRPARPHPAARDLRVLCEALLTRAGALHGLGNFLGSALPEPSGARILGALLFLAGCEDSARFWWQYGAGASDTVSSYCLYLHHRSVGEDEEADWWLRHTEITPATLNREATELEIATALHVLTALRRGRKGLPKALRALVEYVPAVVGFVDDDLELPLPDGDLADIVEEVVAHGTRPAAERRRTRSGALPARREPAVHTVSSATPWTVREWSRDVQEALRKCEETVAC
ncbi:hypothetical protein [Streptomyces sp. A012304]|uniref:hypothetical protein n=1 Tax=Streptomyces sp. A012304 TaxID=375446 RepID=UPI002231988F|nr:hypothetical protein [Streptomyces sp. A012304]GKQ33919.1 hypothetical protein ALMP_04700 [Streptomyces sp. A012304]